MPRLGTYQDESRDLEAKPSSSVVLVLGKLIESYLGEFTSHV